MDLRWEDRKHGAGEIERCRARLPGDIGWVNLAHYAHPKNAFAMHYMVTELPEGANFSGMERYVGRFQSMDELKAAVPALLTGEMRSRILPYRSRIDGIGEAMRICQLAGEDT